MKKFLFLVISVLVVVPCRAQWNYPPTKNRRCVGHLFGKTYNDPYRWLENLKDADVEAWFKAQAELTDGLLAKIPGRDALVQEWLALDKLKPAEYSSIHYEHGRVFYKKTLGGENVGKLYFRRAGTARKNSFSIPPRTKECDHDHSKYCPVVGRETRRDGAFFGRRRVVGDPGIGTWNGEPCCPTASILPTVLTVGEGQQVILL